VLSLKAYILTKKTHTGSIIWIQVMGGKGFMVFDWDWSHIVTLFIQL